ncbi:TraB/GumN family protein [Chitinophaga vietnamensis]|uniref:TraB/GumN family protein n=1 Tax=Chitinophaga vietnamensis TaxID=2593957 RepID=UPI0011778949|nr:TraB/GumN family protein [Chitinophaga vietnamensis]
MKRIIVALLLLASLGALAQQASQEKSLLWEISGKGLTHMPVAVMEKMSEQIEYFNKGMTDEVTLRSIRYVDKYKSVISGLVSDYKQENIQGVYKMLTGPAMADDSMNYWLVFHRNANWVERMPAVLQQRSNFFAVGAGHLAGEKGVIALLRAKGYIVTPVMK